MMEPDMVLLFKGNDSIFGGGVIADLKLMFT